MKSYEAIVLNDRTVLINGKKFSIPQWSGWWDNLSDDMTVVIGIIKEMGYTPKFFLETLLGMVENDDIK